MFQSQQIKSPASQIGEKRIEITTTVKKMLADVYTPVGIYLRLRDRFRDTILLESTDHHAAENSYSFICINAIAGIEIKDKNTFEYKLPNENAVRSALLKGKELKDVLLEFMQRFSLKAENQKSAQFAQGLYGYFSFNGVELVESIEFKTVTDDSNAIPLARYRLYQYVIAINHYKDELLLIENEITGVDSESGTIEALINSKDIPVYPFKATSAETSNMSDEEYLEIVKKGIQSCFRGDVFQIVLSRRFQQQFIGDEFN
ncbi:MAG TPA: hypothetical protein VM368_06060, partial [Flavisolibacter sp.]|nr:hypothetical protein [Flavisolibacter sp.]